MAALAELMRGHGFAPVLGHAPYTLNPCSRDPSLRDFAARVLREDLATLEYLPGNLYNFHPGSHGGQGAEAGVGQIADALNRTLRADMRTTVLLETMSGKGTEVGSDFSELKAIMDRVSLADKLGVCLDTCHVYAAGYDVVGALDGVLEAFDRAVGLGRLKAVHLNDSMTALGSRKDRHAKIGQGTLGLDAIGRIIAHPALSALPFYLETPNELPGYAEEIALLKRLAES
jgi:deoxyribonuclease-4